MLSIICDDDKKFVLQHNDINTGIRVVICSGKALHVFLRYELTNLLPTPY